jgi:hypothetical protein
MKLKIKLAVMVLPCALLAGCGGDYVTVQGATTVSKGQELSDLKRALNEGAITQQEFEWLQLTILRPPS